MPTRTWEYWRGGKLREVLVVADDRALDRLLHGWQLRNPQPPLPNSTNAEEATK